MDLDLETMLSLMAAPIYARLRGFTGNKEETEVLMKMALAEAKMLWSVVSQNARHDFDDEE